MHQPTGNQPCCRDDNLTVRHAIRTPVLSFALGALALVLAATAAAAHTEPDAVALPAGEEVTLTLRPTHGCDGAPTIQVSARIPVPDAIAEPVDGWSAASESDGEGRSVVTWSGGLLPDDEPGAFPVTFTTPDAVGELLTFPFVQECDGGAELAWIAGDPDADYPAPRVLVLPPGSPAAATIDDVPADAPGRELLLEVVDIDGGAEEPATTTTAGADDVASTTTEAMEVDDDTVDDDEESGGLPVVAVLLGLALGATGGFLAVRRWRR
ncbi:MAG: DUF1775 domain-containing protein [Acidimicrobiales bacterium]